MGAAVSFAVAVAATADAVGVGVPVAGGVGVGEVSVIPPLQAASKSTAATKASGRALNLSLLTLRGYGCRRAGSLRVAGEQFADVLVELLALFGDAVAEAGDGDREPPVAEEVLIDSDVLAVGAVDRADDKGASEEG